MDNFSTKTERKGDVTVVSIAGRVDSISAPTMEARLAKIVQENPKIVVDLENVKYMSSAGVRAIGRASQAAQKLAGSVKMANLHEPVVLVMQTVGMMELLESYPSVDEAVASFATA
jgi:anti-sigma B factor antagonist